MPIAEPVGDKLPNGELVPLLDRESERSLSDEELRVDERPRDSDLESLVNEYEPVVVEPLVGEHPPGDLRRPSRTASVGERKAEPWGELGTEELCVAIRGTETGIAGPL